MTANKHQDIRCALCWMPELAVLARKHNNANMLAMGGGMIGANLAVAIVDTFLDTPFSGLEKHCRRIGEISNQEKDF